MTYGIVTFNAGISGFTLKVLFRGERNGTYLFTPLALGQDKIEDPISCKSDSFRRAPGEEVLWTYLDELIRLLSHVELLITTSVLLQFVHIR